MSSDKKIKGAPFGTQSDSSYKYVRFSVNGIYPKVKKPGSYLQISYHPTDGTGPELGPGKYDVYNEGCFSEKVLNENSLHPGWARSLELERLAKMPHLLYKDAWEEKQRMKRKIGPGTYNIKDFLDVADEKPRSIRGIVDTRDKRFSPPYRARPLRKLLRDQVPGPGTYGKGGVPHAAREEKNQQSTSTIGMLDSGSGNRNLPSVGSHLGPGTYKHKTFMEDLENRVISLRGPYDIFSLDRNKPIKTGHYATLTNSTLGPGSFEIKPFTQELGSHALKHHGKFSKLAQYPAKPTDRMFLNQLSQYPRDVTDPGPAHYEPKNPNHSKPLTQAQKSPPFLSSASRSDKISTKFFTGNHNSVGAGRYDVQKFEEGKHRNGHTYHFKSKTGRLDPAKNKQFLERIRAKEIPVRDRVFLLKPEHPSTAMARTQTYMARSAVAPNALPQRALTVA